MAHPEFCPFHLFQKGMFSLEQILILCSRVISLSSSQLMEAPSPLHYSAVISPQIHNSAPPTLQKAVIFLLAEFQIYLTTQAEFVGVQYVLIHIQLNSRDQMK